jgi:hypothetical protein
MHALQNMKIMPLGFCHKYSDYALFTKYKGNICTIFVPFTLTYFDSGGKFNDYTFFLSRKTTPLCEGHAFPSACLWPRIGAWTVKRRFF